MKVRSLEFLREIEKSFSESHDVCAACGWAADEIEQLKEQVDALQHSLDLAKSEIAGRNQEFERPFERRTADGVRITLGMTVWVITNKIAKQHVVRLIEIAEEGCWVSWGWTREAYRSELLYSTLAAAVEAIKAGN